jgi:hypothetical protein
MREPCRFGSLPSGNLYPNTRTHWAVLALPHRELHDDESIFIQRTPRNGMSNAPPDVSGFEQTRQIAA